MGLIESERTAREKLEQSHKEVLESVRMLEESHGELLGHHENAKGSLATHQATMEERLVYLENLLNESAENHEAMKGHHGGIQERLAQLEEKLEGELGKEITARETNVDELRELVGVENLARLEHLESVKELIESERLARGNLEENIRSDLAR